MKCNVQGNLEQYDNACDDTCNNCFDRREVGDYVYENADDADCNECGAEREMPQSP